MNISIYQIDHDRDENRVKFESFESTLKYQGSDKIDSAIYKKVFDGAVDCKNLEEVYTMFNINHPTEFIGNSLSVSDIVEVKGGCSDLVGKIRFYNSPTLFEEVDYVDTGKFQKEIKEAQYVGRTIEVIDLKNTNVPSVENGFYFCDNARFEKVEFTPPESKKETMKVVLVKANKKSEIAEIDFSLEGMQKIVGGNMKAMYPYEEEVAVICNEEGKMCGLPLNRAIYSDSNEMLDIIAGNFFICGLGEDDFCSLNDEQLKLFSEKFKLPERFSKMGDDIKAVTFNPDKNKNYER